MIIYVKGWATEIPQHIRKPPVWNKAIMDVTTRYFDHNSSLSSETAQIKEDLVAASSLGTVSYTSSQ